MSDIDQQTVEEPEDLAAGAAERSSSDPVGVAETEQGSAAPEAAVAPAVLAEKDPGGEQALEDDVDTPFGAHSELLALATERDKYLALAQRTQADFENYRKRVAREAAAAQERGIGSLAKELLPALDNLDRALDSAAQDDPLLQGVRLVRAELSAALARCRIESFSPLGEPFDPSLHEAIATAEQPADGLPSGSVVEVYQPGYRLGESVIRPARVVVAA